MSHRFLVVSVNLCRFLLAFTFLFSGFVKAIDPMGMAIKLHAYLNHWGVYLNVYSLPLSVLAISLGVAEFMLGIYLFLGMRRKFTTVTTFLLMLIMTALTVYIYLYNPVPDCGCFGDALRLTHGETLCKNILLLLAASLILFYPQHIRRLVSERHQWVTSLFSFIYILSVSLYCKHYLPSLDFTPYKVGTDLRAARNLEAGEEAFEAFANLWMMDKRGNDMTDSLLNDTNYIFILTSPQLESADDGISDRINDLQDLSEDRHIRLYCLTSSDSTAISQWIDRTGAAYPFLLGETEQIEAMVRSNPGLLLLKEGKIYGKWSANALPSEGDIEASLQPQHRETSRQLSKLSLIFFIPLFIVIFADNIWVGSKYFRRYRQRKKQNASAHDES